ncbi:radical SAM protein [Candidatus Omnitrophota bacterium]
MKSRRYKYIYGPVSSWRLGRSLGVDAVSAGQKKICSFDCIYCQAGKTKDLTAKRRVFIPTGTIAEEIKSLPPVKIDYITFSGRGEPTLAKNLGELIRKVKKIRKKKIAVITNSSLLFRKDVRRDLAPADFVMAKFDASTEDVFRKVNKPAKSVRLTKTIKGIKEFKRRYKGKFALQIMFVKKNVKFAEEIAKLAKNIKPDLVQINTPLRPSGVRPVSRKEMKDIKKLFKGIKVVSVYDA